MKIAEAWKLKVQGCKKLRGLKALSFCSELKLETQGSNNRS